MTGNAVRPGELPKEPLQSVSAALDSRIALRVGPFEIGVRHQPRTAMTGTDDVDHVQIVLFDQPVQVHIEEIQPGRRAPMPEQTGLDVFEPERGFEQRIVLQIDLPDREVICRAPIGVHFLQQIGAQRCNHRDSLGARSRATPDRFEDGLLRRHGASIMLNAAETCATISRGAGSRAGDGCQSAWSASTSEH